MKNLDVTKMSTEELEAKVLEIRKELIKLNAQTATGTSSKNPMQIRNNKKTIARLYTALSVKGVNK